MAISVTLLEFNLLEKEKNLLEQLFSVSSKKLVLSSSEQFLVKNFITICIKIAILHQLLWSNESNKIAMNRQPKRVKAVAVQHQQQ